MSTGTVGDSPEPDGLQFDHAEFGQAQETDAVVCGSCRRPIDDHYFEINGTVVCEACREAIEAQLRGGSGVARFLKAALYGLGAAIVGYVVYTAFVHFTRIDLSLVAILVGFFVGKMVRQGSGRLGGRPYQFLAVFLTYTSLAFTYLTLRLLNLFAANQEAWALLKVPAFYVACLMNVFQMPVEEISSSPITIAFVGFALWEAWKFNRRLPLVVTGPYRLGTMDQDEGEPAHA